jgi:hypothetical protein
MLENIQAIISVITDAPDAELRKTAFAALKRVKFLVFCISFHSYKEMISLLLSYLA